jgi:hypothetical protein
MNREPTRFLVVSIIISLYSEIPLLAFLPQKTI